ncbi:hypothetical protein [Pleionea sp. CnH1-48]|uniref:hypothetical protein n=1 Tax=Pleionea sp. CnH1-48 TaxID=2954494 RepID=UPI002097F111|nr:hypothetical protein [Pleionea sp. CnH1-48]MCO7226061.1 hypothetical protein [Pleionea sp. CnH1-48]
MSRYCGNRSTVGKFELALAWKKQCLINEGSLFTDKSIWTKANINELAKHYFDNAPASDGNFLQRLKVQLSAAPADCQLLCAEILWSMLFCPSNISATTKINTFSIVLSWGDEVLESSSSFADESLIEGFGSGGPGYNTFRQKELSYAIEMMAALLALSASERSDLLSDPLECATWLESIPGNEKRQFRHMFLFMLFPDHYERLFGAGDRVRVAAAFSQFSANALKKKSVFELDGVIRDIRCQYEAKYPGQLLDWYLSPLREYWR